MTAARFLCSSMQRPLSGVACIRHDAIAACSTVSGQQPMWRETNVTNMHVTQFGQQGFCWLSHITVSLGVALTSQIFALCTQLHLDTVC